MPKKKLFCIVQPFSTDDRLSTRLMVVNQAEFKEFDRTLTTYGYHHTPSHVGKVVYRKVDVKDLDTIRVILSGDGWAEGSLILPHEVVVDVRHVPDVFQTLPLALTAIHDG